MSFVQNHECGARLTEWDAAAGGGSVEDKDHVLLRDAWHAQMQSAAPARQHAGGLYA